MGEFVSIVSCPADHSQGDDPSEMNRFVEFSTKRLIATGFAFSEDCVLVGNLAY